MFYYFCSLLEEVLLEDVVLGEVSRLFELEPVFGTGGLTIFSSIDCLTFSCLRKVNICPNAKEIVAYYVKNNFDSVGNVNSDVEEIVREEPKFKAIQSQSVKSLSYQIEKFQIFTNWLSDGYGDVVGDHFKKKILTKFDLRAFTFHELSTCVRRSFLFSEEEILDAVLWKNCQLQIQMASLRLTSETMKNDLLQLESQNTILKHLKSWSSTIEIQELERERDCYKNLFEKEQKFVKYINNQFYFIDGRDLRHWQTPSNIEQIRAEFDRKCGPGS